MIYGYGQNAISINNSMLGSGSIASPFTFGSVHDLAFSVRKVNSDYIGNCMRIRRSTDNSELDIGFSGVDLDTSAISTFCGAGFGYVVKWYDQSGNTKDKSNTTASRQPVIYNNGFTLRNGKPYISASRTQYLYLATGYTQTKLEDYTLFMTYEKDTSGNQFILFNTGSLYSWSDNGLSQVVAELSSITISSIYETNTLYLNNTISNASTGSEMFRNGASIGTRGVNTRNGGLRYLPSPSFRTTTVLFSEFIWYKEDKTSSALDMRNDINNYYSIF
jgi:hypothetical protein